MSRMQEVKLRRKAEEKEAKEAQRAAKAAARQAELAALPEEERKRVEEERAARKLALLNEQRKEKDAKKERMLKVSGLLPLGAAARRSVDCLWLRLLPYFPWRSSLFLLSSTL